MANKEVDETFDELMKKPGVLGYVIINNDGIPVRSYPEESTPSVQYAALITDLVMKTK